MPLHFTSTLLLIAQLPHVKEATFRAVHRAEPRKLSAQCMVIHLDTPQLVPILTLLLIAQLFALEAGDVLFTGTPSGVAPLAVGDDVEARVEGLEPCRFRVGPVLPPTTH